jgi:hypothetical protein
MNKIKTFYFGHLRNEAHYEYHFQFKGLLDDVPAVKSVVEQDYPPYNAALTVEGSLLDAMRKSDYTEEIAEADHRVDRCITGMNAAIATGMHHFNPEVVKAAKSLYNRFNAFGNIRKKSYEEESAAVIVLLNDLGSAEYVAKVALVGLTPWVAELAAAEEEFDRLFVLRAKEGASKPQGRMSGARRDTELTYHPIVGRVNAYVYMASGQVPPEFLTFINNVNEVIDYFHERYHHVKKDISVAGHCVIESIGTQQYTGKEIIPIPTAFYREEGKPTVELVFAKDFSVTYKNNTEVGMAEVTIHGKGGYKGQKTVTFNIAR